MAVDIKDAIQDALRDYGKDVTKEMDAAVVKVAGNVVKNLKKKKRFAPKSHSTGKYAGSWKKKVEKGVLSTDAIVYNDKHYRLTHLLEFGHATANGNGRAYPDTPAYPHIAQAEEQAGEELLKEIERRIKK